MQEAEEWSLRYEDRGLCRKVSSNRAAYTLNMQNEKCPARTCCIWRLVNICFSWVNQWEKITIGAFPVFLGHQPLSPTERFTLQWPLRVKLRTGLASSVVPRYPWSVHWWKTSAWCLKCLQWEKVLIPNQRLNALKENTYWRLPCTESHCYINQSDRECRWQTQCFLLLHCFVGCKLSASQRSRPERPPWGTGQLPNRGRDRQQSCHVKKSAPGNCIAASARCNYLRLSHGKRISSWRNCYQVWLERPIALFDGSVW